MHEIELHILAWYLNQLIADTVWNLLFSALMQVPSVDSSVLVARGGVASRGVQSPGIRNDKDESWGTELGRRHRHAASDPP